jgi:hypothetical protein
MIDDGKSMQLLNKGAGSIQVTCPVRLIQGLGDEEIPPERALKLSDSLQVNDFEAELCTCVWSLCILQLALQQHTNNQSILSESGRHVLQGQNVVVTYVKYGKHDMDETEEDYQRMFVAIQVSRPACLSRTVLGVRHVASLLVI